LSHIVLFVEGYSDEEVLKGLLRAVVARLREARIGLRVRRAIDAPKLDRKIGRSAFHQLRKPEVVAVFALRDLDAPADEAEGRIRTLRATAYKELRPDQRRQFHAHVAVPQIEAWLLADPDALRRVLRMQPDCSLANPEETAGGKSPKERLDELFHNFRGRGYQPTKDGGHIAAEAAPEEVARRCPSFRAVANDLLVCAELPALY
jgi:hypothetical protein